jgi:hypothetical protein
VPFQAFDFTSDPFGFALLKDLFEFGRFFFNPFGVFLKFFGFFGFAFWGLFVLDSGPSCPGRRAAFFLHEFFVFPEEPAIFGVFTFLRAQ